VSINVPAPLVISEPSVPHINVMVLIPQIQKYVTARVHVTHQMLVCVKQDFMEAIVRFLDVMVKVLMYHPSALVTDSVRDQMFVSVEKTTPVQTAQKQHVIQLHQLELRHVQVMVPVFHTTIAPVVKDIMDLTVKSIVVIHCYQMIQQFALERVIVLA
jgi:hypothetical protein